MGRVTELIHFLNLKTKPSRLEIEETYDYITFYSYDKIEKKFALNNCGKKINDKRKQINENKKCESKRKKSPKFS